MTDSPEAASTSTRALPATPSFGASDALSVRGAPITRRTSVWAASDSRSVATARPCSSRRAASSRPRAASCTTSPARVAARRVARGDLAVREPLEVRGLDRPSLLMWQLPEQGAHARRSLASLYGVVGAFGWSVLTRLHPASQLCLSQRGPRPPAVDRHVADETQEPGPRLAARRVIAPRPSPDAQEGLLDGILGELPVARDAECDSIGERREPVVESGERRVVAACDADQQRGLDIRRRRQRPATRAGAELPGQAKPDREAAERGTESDPELGPGEPSAGERERHAEERAHRHHAADRAHAEDHHVGERERR